MLLQRGQFEQLLQEVCSQGMPQVPVRRSLRLFVFYNVFQADLEKLLLDFCDTPPCARTAKQCHHS
jgi:hypothetical protein